jgi:ABC-2 type transport system ATP-binding protein
MSMKINDNEQIAIAAHGLCKSFNGKLAVNNVSIQVKVGEIFGFLGPNGGGKTTTIRMLCGLLIPDKGGGHCLGKDILTEFDDLKLDVGYMTQKFSLYEGLTVRENLDFMAHLYQVKNRNEAVDKAIEDLGLKDRANQLTGTLSGGWKQRLSLTAALLHNPKILLLDEPTAGVDPKARREFWDHIHDLAESGITILVSTHYMDEAERCHRLSYIFEGNILIQGTKEEVIGHANLVTWVVSGSNLREASHILKILPGIDQVVAFGDSLHISGKDEDMITKSIQDRRLEKCRFSQIEPSLEDVFINLGEGI